MRDIRENCAIWAQGTFEELLGTIENLSPDIKAASLKCFRNLEISQKLVNGYACEKLPKSEEGMLGVGINYTDVFHKLLDQSRFTPVSYLVDLIGRYKEKGGADHKLDGFIARGLRTLTSLLREPAFAVSLERCLSSRGQDVVAILNPEQDARDHTDVLLTYAGKTYRIWLFQFSPRGLPHDIERITGRRGEILPGIHILCPLKTECAIEYGKIDARSKKTAAAILKLEQLLGSCSDHAKKKRVNLANRLRAQEQKLIDLDRRLEIMSEKIAFELDIVEGWYFYSSLHVQRIANLIRDGKNVDTYDRVVETLLSAETFLSEARIFEKTG